jgi:hypothetical protein
MAVTADRTRCRGCYSWQLAGAGVHIRQRGRAGQMLTAKLSPYSVTPAALPLPAGAAVAKLSPSSSDCSRSSLKATVACEEAVHPTAELRLDWRHPEVRRSRLAGTLAWLHTHTMFQCTQLQLAVDYAVAQHPCTFQTHYCHACRGFTHSLKCFNLNMLQVGSTAQPKIHSAPAMADVG